MRHRHYTYLLFFVAVVFSCNQGAEDQPKAIGKATPAADSIAHHFIINSNGDTIPTGVPFPAKGKWANPDSFAKPIRIPLKAKPKVVTIPPPVKYQAVTSKIVKVPKDLKLITPGENGVPLPQPVPTKGKVVPALQPKPQPASAFRFKDLATMNIQYLDIDMGPGSNSIGSMLEDGNGNTWLATSAGIIRFDGKNMVIYTQKEGLSNNDVAAMIMDRKGNIWFGTWGGGVNRYDGKTFTHFTEQDGLSSDAATSLLEDNKGRLWFGTHNGVTLYDGEKFTQYTEKEGLNGVRVNSMFEDNEGYIWFGAIGAGVTRFDGKSFTHYSTKEGLLDNLVYCFHQDNQGDIWMGTWGGLSRFDGERFMNYTVEEGLANNAVTAIMQDRHGNLWLGHWRSRVRPPQGVTRFDGKEFTYYTTKEGLNRNEVFSFMEDKSGNIWIGFEGISRLKEGSFIHSTEGDELNDVQVSCFMEDSQNNLWFGSHRGGLVRFDGSSYTFLKTEQGLVSNISNKIVEDKHGNIWFDDGARSIIKFDGSSFTKFTKKEGLELKSGHPNIEDSRGNIWFGWDNGASSYDGNSFTHYSVQEGLHCGMVREILEDSRCNLWFGGNGTVVRYDGQYFTHYNINEGSDIRGVSCIIEDFRENIWFGTTDGISRFDGKKFYHYTDQEDLGKNEVYSMAEDKRGNIWISHYNGITLLAPLSNQSSTGKSARSDQPAALVDDYRVYDFEKPDGLKDNMHLCSYIDRENRIWWGRSDGYTMLDLNQFELPTEPPRNVQLSHLEIGQQFVDFRRLADESFSHTLPFGKSLRNSFDSVAPFTNYPVTMKLPHDLNHLTFHFSAIDWAAPQKIQYSYFLEGYDKQWSILQSENIADYRSIPHGSYTLKVKAIGVAQVWSEPFEYSFTIRPPWWRARWAYLLYVLAITGLLLSIRRYELRRKLAAAEARRLQELDTVKSRLYTNVTHEFRTPLTVILGMTEQVRAQVSESAHAGLDMIKRNGRQLLHLVNQMLDLAKLESGSLPVQCVQGDVVLFLKYLLESFHSLAQGKGVALHFESSQPTFMMDYDPDMLQKIVANLLSNAIKFTPEGGEVALAVRLNPSSAAELGFVGTIALTISDTGAGIPAGQLERIFDRFYQVQDTHTRQAEGAGVGLSLTKELVKLLGGSIGVSSEEGRGAEFTVTLPVKREAPLLDRAEALAGAETYEPIASRSQQFEKPDSLDAAEKPLLLIIEDNADVVHYIAACLKGSYQLVTAGNGREGVEAAIEMVPDLIISDVMMPEMDGFEVCDTLKNDERTSHVPIVLLTAKADEASRLTGLRRGADAYLAKPFNEEELFIHLEKLIELRKKLQARYSMSDLGFRISEAVEPSLSEIRNPTSEIEDRFLKKLRDFVEAGITAPDLDIVQAARQLAMSRSQLFRKVKALTGKSPSLFVRSIRLQKAASLLRTTELNVSEIAYEVGFADPAYFANAFREEFGRSPSDFRAT